MIYKSKKSGKLLKLKKQYRFGISSYVVVDASGSPVESAQPWSTGSQKFESVKIIKGMDKLEPITI